MATRGNTKLQGFYFPWPLRNIQFARQIDQSRENTFKIAPLVRAAYVDPQPVTANDPGNADLSGWAVGMRDFRNKFRIYYDQVNFRFSIQHNVGTEAIETWDDMLYIRESDGRVTIVQDGGLEAQGGFYNQVPRNLATSGRFDPPSTEWVFTHNLNTKPILWDTFNLGDKSIVPQSVNVNNPNIAYFYFSSPQSGFAVVTGEQSRFEGIRVDDGNGNVFPTATRLGFNSAQFYASTDGHGMPVINLQPLDLSGVDPTTVPVNLTVTDTAASQTFTLVKKLTFRQADFYFRTDSQGFPIINIRGGAGSGGSGVFGSGIFAQDFSSSNEWTLNHGLGVNNIIWSVYDDQGLAVIPQKVSIHNSNVSYFYFSPAVAGRAVVVGGPVFQGILAVNETDGSPSFSNVSNLIFNSGDFYLAPDSTGKPVVNFRGTSGGGGGGGLNNVVEDLTPQLGGDLDVNGFSITTVGDPSGDVNIKTGAAVGDAGSLVIQPGNSSGGAGGSVLILAGSGFTAGGVIQLQSSGDLALGSGSGSILLTPSVATDAGTAKIVNLLDPTNSQDAATKAYVDAHMGGGFYGIFICESDGNPPANRNDTIIFDSTAFYINSNSVGKPMISFRGAVSGGGSGITAVVQDTNPQLGGNLNGGGFFITNIADPTTAQGAATKNYVDTTMSPGFYGIIWSDGLVTKRTDRLSFNKNEFYLDGTRPTLNIKESGIDHSLLANLTVGDPHTQYSLVTGTRAFTGTVGGITPVASSDLATKGYVDTNLGPGFYGIFIRESDGNPPANRNDTIIFDSTAFYINSNSVGKPMISFRGSIISGAGGITAVVQDTNPQLGGNLNGGGFSITNIADPTTAQGAATKNYVDTQIGPGFYGVIWSDGTITKRTDRLSFSNANFYLDGSRPTVNLKQIDHNSLSNLTVGDPHTQYILVNGTRAFTGAQSMGSNKLTNVTDPTTAQDAATKNYVDTTASPGFYGLFIKESRAGATVFKNDTLIFDSLAFYVNPTSVGKPMVSLRATARGVDFADGVHLLLNKTRLNFNDKDFYLSQTASGDPMLNLRYEEDIYPIYIELGSIQNVVIDPFAQYPYTLDRADMDCRAGSATGGFYIIPASNPSGLGRRIGRGQPVGNFDQLSITTAPARYIPTTNRTVNPGDCLMLAIFGNSASKHIRVSLVTRKPN
jgi:hypothetical protein